MRGELDYDVNRRAEAEIQGLARKLNLLGDKIGDVEDLLRERSARGELPVDHVANSGGAKGVRVYSE